MLNGANRLTEKVYEYCMAQGLLEPGIKVVVGVSGGADSVCLLRMLCEMKDALNLSLVCVHIEHGIRGEESLSDRDFVKDLCGRLDIRLKIHEEDVPALAREKSMTLEEAGRYVRYRVFDEVLKEEGADVIAVAHHKGDQAETVIFNMIRGSGLKGGSGMAPRNNKLIRPLLAVSREEIEGYLKDIGQEHRTDSTNEDESYTRNAIRNRIIPELEQITGGAVDHIVSWADEAREADDYLREKAAVVYGRAVSKKDALYRVDIKVLLEEPPIIQRYVLRSLLTGLYTSHKDLEALHVKSLADLCTKQSGRFLSLPKGMEARRVGDHLLVGSTLDISPDEEGVDRVLEPNGETRVNGYGIFKASVEDMAADLHIPDSLYTKWFDYDKIISGVHVRTRMAGDYLTIGRDEFKKKLKNYLIDEKVPVSERDRMLVLADGPHVMWVVGMRISEHYKIDKETRHILKIEYKEMDDGK